MKILKPGKVEQRKFVCPLCECEFVAGNGELVYKLRLSNCRFAEIMCCPYCGKEMSWEIGEPYEEPTLYEREMLARLIEASRSFSSSTAKAAYLIANGVTFR